jgi:hypothetical protein
MTAESNFLNIVEQNPITFAVKTLEITMSWAALNEKECDFLLRFTDALLYIIEQDKDIKVLSQYLPELPKAMDFYIANNKIFIYTVFSIEKNHDDYILRYVEKPSIENAISIHKIAIQAHAKSVKRSIGLPESSMKKFDSFFCMLESISQKVQIQKHILFG